MYPVLLITLPIVFIRSPVSPQHFNCPARPQPIGIPRAVSTTLYSFCVSSLAHCDCHLEDPVGHPSIYSVFCHEDGRSDQHNYSLELAIYDCVTSCVCYGGPRSNWISWPNGPPAVGPSVPATSLQIANGRALVPGLRWGPQGIS